MIAIVFGLLAGLLSVTPRAAQAAQVGEALIRVSDPHGGPIAFYTLTVMRLDGKRFEELLTREVHMRERRGDGLRLDDLVPGTYRLRVAAPGFARRWSETFHISAGERSIVDVGLDFGGSIVGIVVDEHGDPARGAVVETIPVFALQPSLAMRRIEVHVATAAVTRVDRFGRFCLRRLEPGPYNLRIRLPDRCPHVVRDIDIGGTSRVDVGRTALQRGAMVRGKAPVWSKDPITMVSVFTVDTEGARSFVTGAEANERGCFVLPERVPAGRFLVVYEPLADASAFEYRGGIPESIEVPLIVAAGQQRLELDEPGPR